MVTAPHTVDAAILSTMTDASYRSYLKNAKLIYIDSQGTLRCAAADCTLATTREQFEIFVDELIALRNGMEPRVLG
jgi:UDP-N-acetyl-D-mannosaminuronic acid transferase (WecB/TagA/CpsF family)